MASVFRHRGRWYMRWKNAPGRQPRYVKAAGEVGWSKQKAQHEANARERQAQAGEVPLEGAEELTLAELCRWWLEKWCKRASYDRELSRLKSNIFAWPIGGVPLRSVTAQVIEGRLREMEAAGAATASVEHVRRTLRTIFNRAIKTRVWNKNPAAEAHARSMDPAREIRPSRKTRCGASSALSASPGSAIWW
jgi:hypothetical protein